MLLAEGALFLLGVLVVELPAPWRTVGLVILSVVLVTALRDFWAWVAASGEERARFLEASGREDARRREAGQQLGAGFRWWHRLSLLVLLAGNVFAVWKTGALVAAVPLIILVPLTLLSTVDLFRARAR